MTATRPPTSSSSPDSADPAQRDGRSLDRRTQEHLRLLGAERVLAGERVTDVARLLGVDRSVVSRWASTAKQHGLGALRATVAPGRAPTLDDEQVGFVRLLILQLEPEILGFESALWTRAMVAALIERLYGHRLSVEAVGRMMRDRMGLSPQRPVRRASEASAAEARRWVERDYPAIEARAKAVGARIYFADEASVRSDYHSGTTWAAVGQTPVVRGEAKRAGVNLISAISPDGELRWARVEGRMTAERFIDFLGALIEDEQKPVFVIVDNHPVHRSKAVAAFVEANAQRLELHFLPPYSPELNPDEQVWNHLKHHTMGKRARGKAKQLWRWVSEHLDGLATMPALIRAFFRQPDCRYAAAAV